MTDWYTEPEPTQTIEDLHADGLDVCQACNGTGQWEDPDVRQRGKCDAPKCDKGLVPLDLDDYEAQALEWYDHLAQFESYDDYWGKR